MEKNLRSRLLLVLIVIIGLLPLNVFAASPDLGKVRLLDHSSGRVKEYISAHITLGGDDVVTDVPAIIYIEWRNNVQYSRTLVPIRAITEQLGAKVTWDNSTQTAHVYYEGKDIALTLESDTAYVNGKAVALPDGIPAKLMSYNGVNRTMVPLRFLSEEMGLNVGWDSISNVIKLNRPLQRIENISYSKNDGVEEFVITASDKVSYVDYFVDGTGLNRDSKIVLKVGNVVLAEDKIATDSNGNVVKQINQGAIKNFIAVQKTDADVPEVEMEINLSKARGYEIKEAGNQLIISLNNSVSEIYVENLIGEEYIVAKATEEPVFKVSKWPEKNKYIVDIMGTKLENAGEGIQELAINNKAIKKVTYAQLDAKEIYGEGKWVTRIVLELADFRDADKVEVKPLGTQLLIHLDKKVGEKPIEYYALDKKSSLLKILAKNAKNQSIYYDRDDNILRVKINKEDAALTKNTFEPDDQRVSRIEVGESGDYYNVKVYLSRGVSYSQEYSQTDALAFRIYTENRIVRTDKGRKLIVIDAGHGGKDPGAISPIDGTKEKDVNLKFALRLQQLLENNGFDAYLTRSTDKYLGLYTITDIANDLKADAFISIHANTAQNSSAKGIETLYGQSPLYAKAIHRNIIKMTGATDRGIKTRMDLAVIRTSDMSAVLIETGFLSNREDLKNLHDNEYIDKLNQGILNGLLEYFALE